MKVFITKNKLCRRKLDLQNVFPIDPYITHVYIHEDLRDSHLMVYWYNRFKACKGGMVSSALWMHLVLIVSVNIG